MSDPAINEAVPKAGISKREVDGEVIEITRVYQVLTAQDVTDIFSVVTDLPAADSAHPDYTDLAVVERNPTQTERDIGLRWEIEIVWREPDEDQEEGEETIGRVTSVSGGPASGTHALICDAQTGKLIKNSAGDPFDDVEQVQSSGIEVVIVREENKAPKDVLPGLQGTVNENTEYVAGFVFATRQARLTIRFRRLVRQAYDWEYTYTVSQKIQMAKLKHDLQVEDHGWRVLKLDQGYRSLDESIDYRPDRVVERMEGDDGMVHPVSRPVLLDGNGNIAGEDAFKNIPFDGYKLASWSALNLDLYDDEPVE